MQYPFSGSLYEFKLYFVPTSREKKRERERERESRSAERAMIKLVLAS